MNSKPWLAGAVTQQKQPATLCNPSVISVTLSGEDMEGGQHCKTGESFSVRLAIPQGCPPALSPRGAFWVEGSGEVRTRFRQN